MFNINFKKAAILLTAFSMFFLISCSGEGSTSEDTSSANSSSSVVDTSNGKCPLDGMVDEYQNLADKLKNAMDSNDFSTIMSVNQDVAAWLKKWESASSDAADNCSLQDITSATNRMQAIALSLME